MDWAQTEAVEVHVLLARNGGDKHMTSMIERVARAICENQYRKAKDYPGSGFDVEVYKWVERHWPNDIGAAKAAIAAMREPNSKMLRAAEAAMSPGKRPTQKRVSVRAKHGIRYRAMIDAALSESTET